MIRFELPIILILILSFFNIYRKCNVIIKIQNKEQEVINNTKVYLKNCNSKFKLTTNSKGLIYLKNIPCGYYEIRVYIDENQYLYGKVKIKSSGYYDVILNTILYSKIYGIIYDKKDKKPLSKASVILFKKIRSHLYIPIKATITDEKGFYSFNKVKRGRYFIKSIR